jgi:metallophosphoesterase (TIGR00282 family)
MIGDVVGDCGLAALERELPPLIAAYGADFTVVNGENAAAGFGLTREALDRILAAGADAVSGGNHTWEKRDFWPVLDSGKPVLRPANYPGSGKTAKTPGRGWLRLEKQSSGGGRISCTVINLQGRDRMTPIDCPFRCFDTIFAETGPQGNTAGQDNAAQGKEPPQTTQSALIVDFHAESTREKEALGYYLDGRAHIVAGTHTHVQTADERILPKGSAYITDLGMTGAKNGIIGMDTKICLDRARTQIPYRMECAETGELTIQGIAVELESSGRALSIERIYRVLP